MRTSINQLYEKAYGNYGIGAFNVFNAEQVHGVFRGAMVSGTSVIIQVTPVARDYMRHEILRAMITAAEIIYPEAEFTVHLDHGNYVHCMAAIESGGYNSIMIDASHEPFEENIRVTKEIVERAHDRGIAVEAELGLLSGIEDHISVDTENSFYTNPKQAKEFVERTGCDSLAVAVGTSHGAYKFSGSAGIQLNILKQIQLHLPGFPLVLHGASAVLDDEVKRINLAGGRLKADAKGTDAQELLQAIKMGVCKINIATDMRLIWTRVHREFFLNEPEKFDMVVPGKQYMDELEKFVSEKCLFLKGDTKNDCDDQR
jgi:fructose-bisphosphate aldolase, class II